MADTFTKPERSRIMRAVHSTGTRPEQIVAAVLRAARVRISRNVDNLPGKPDFVIRQARVAVFVHGCFWHGHPCRRGARMPKTNTKYWREKIARNIRRDARVKRELRKRGYAVYTIWECRLKHGWRPTRLLNAVERRLKPQRTQRAQR